LLYHAQIDARAGCVGPLSDRAAHEQQIPYAAGEEPEQLAGFAEAHYTAHARQFRFAGLLSSFLMLVPRTLIDGIGGFDERFSPWGFEDDDFTLRAALFAGHNRVALDVFVRHLGYGGAKAARHEALLEENWKRFRDKWGFDRNARRGDYSGLSRLFQRSWSSTELLVSKAAPDRALEVGS
jgi:GT2 family glycosyltransferase